jgi:3-phenylpropionate/trans-cinnamate dioxygenase ferredoxin subunit
MRVVNYAVSVEPGAKLAEGPYVAETFPVTVEDDYVVVETK